MLSGQKQSEWTNHSKLSTNLEEKLIEILRKAPDAVWQWVSPTQVRVDIPWHRQSYLFDNSAELVASMRLKED
jgi:hypothetical protein